MTRVIRFLSAALDIPRTSFAARFAQLWAGLLLYGLSTSLLVKADLGLDPWDVFHQGIARRTGIAIGTATVAVSIVVLLSWTFLRQRPGLGTLCNGLGVGLIVNVFVDVLPYPHAPIWRAAVLVAGVALNGVATALYIGAGLGPGPRDGLMTGIAARGHSIRATRTTIEVAVLAVGWLMGGTVGIGTVVYALSIGPIVHVLLPLLRRPGVSAEEPSGAG